MYSADYAPWVFVLAWLWVFASAGLAIQMYRLRNQKWPSLGLGRKRGREYGCLVRLVLMYVYSIGVLILAGLVFMSAVVYAVAASSLGDLNETGLLVVGVLGAGLGFAALVAIFASIFD